ncbi:hypothetical protein NE865_10824 [Phthorimaea operculella]|nr:hypothetical protein NE865_10824 [Phthorimaea operculella]
MGALHLAKYGASGVARLLLARGAQPDAPGKSHITPLHMATYYGHPDIALLLLDKGKNVKKESPTRLARATSLAKYGASGVARLLLARGAQPDAPGKSHITPLHMATYYGHPDIALLLLDKGKNVKKESPTRLARATSLAKYGASGVARLLLARGAQPDAPGKSHITPLHMATYYGHPDIALLLLDKGRKFILGVTKQQSWKEVKRGERSPTRLARATSLAKYGASGVARLLLARGAQPDAPGKSHITPLHMATYYGHPDIALLLLDKGRKFILGVTKQQSWKEVKRGERSPTRLARATSLAKYGASGVARLLLARGAQPDAPGKSHITPLHMATYYGHPDIALLLLDKGKTFILAVTKQQIKPQEANFPRGTWVEV